MFVLGIDPGLSRCGYGLVGPGGPTRITARAAGVLTTDPADPLAQRLFELDRQLRSLFADCKPDVVVVERVFFQVNAKTAMSVGQASGLALANAAAHGCEVVQLTSNEVKQGLTGYGAATKAQVKQMVLARLGLDHIDGPPDVTDALALAICQLEGAGLRRALAKAGVSK